jgi:hypothetical protein
MSGFTDFQASGASETSGLSDVVMTWETAQSMIPLVRHIVADVLCHSERIGQLQPERDRLDRKRHGLQWPERQRRYQVTEELTRAEEDLLNARSELAGLGVVLLDDVAGQVGFPTMVNNRRAFFSWRTGEDRVASWHYADNLRRRPVPEEWKEQALEHAPRPSGLE